MSTPTPEERLNALPARIRAAVERVRAARAAEAKVLAEWARKEKPC